MPDVLTSLLDVYASSTITSMCAFHGVMPKTSKTRPAMVAVLAKVLPERERVQLQWQALAPAERALAEAILQRGGQASVRTLREALTQQDMVDKPARPAAGAFGQTKPPDPKAKNSRRFEDVLARLILRGLAFAVDEPALHYPDAPNYDLPRYDFDRVPASVVMPEAIRRYLPEPPPLAPRALEVVKVAAVSESSARVFQRDLYLYWSYARDHTVYLTQKDEVQKSDLKKVSATLLGRETLGKGEGELDHPRLRFVRQLLMAFDLLSFSEGGFLRVATAIDFFSETPARRVEHSFEVWRQNAYFNELLLLPREARPLRPETNLLMAPELVQRARQAVLRAVTTLAGRAGAGNWLALGTLCEYLRETDYEFLFRRLPPRSSYYYFAQLPPYAATSNPLGLEFPGIRSEEEGWHKVEAGFIRGVVAGPLFWMGLAEVGWQNEADRQAPPDAFCLTPLGRWVLGLGPCPEIPSEGGRVIVQPTLHIVALDPVNDVTLATLDRFAERLAAERAVEYQLTRASVYAAQQAGWDVARIKAYLRDQTGADLPGNVARTLEEWQTQHDRIVLRPAVALAHGPAELFDTLNGAGAPVAGRPLPEVLLLSAPAAVPDFVALLRARGILPLVNHQPNLPPHAVQADETGVLRFITGRPGLYLHGHLAAFADPDAAGGYRISAETVARAVRAGLAAPGIISRLAAVHRGPVPEKLLRRIRAWAGHYGAAALEEVVLLQVRDAATLGELRADPELAPLLQDFTPTPQQALACVSPADVEKLRALLAERGLELSDRISQ